MKRLVLFFLFAIGILELKSQLLINEVMNSNTAVYPDNLNKYQDWVEIYNPTNQSIDLKGYSLSDEPKMPNKWIFPTVTIAAKSYLVVFCSERNLSSNGQFHTNFKLGAEEAVYLTSPLGVLIDKVTPSAMLTNYSWGRLTDGSNTWRVFSKSSPNASNTSGTLGPEEISKTKTDQKPGFYAAAINVTLTCPTPGSNVLYSLDGNDPELVYTNPLTIATNKVVKSRCARGKDTSETKTDSYFIGVKHDIPVVSLSFRPADFFSEDSGIYVLGKTYEPYNPNLGANFWENWRRKLHFEYFVNEEEQIEQDLGVEIHGGWSRARAMKSLRLYARSEYGKNELEYPFFAEKPYLTSFKEIVLRNSGSDFNFTMWADALNHRTLGQISEVDRQAYQPVAVYFNGEYMGLHNMRERVAENYLAANHKIEADDMDFLELNGGIEVPAAELPVTNNVVANQVVQGSNKGWLLLHDTIVNNPMSDAIYAYVEKNLDIPTYIDYFAAQTYHINMDWSENNIRYWKTAELDNKWRFCYYDTESGLGIFNFPNTLPTFNELNRIIKDSISVHSFMFAKIIQNKKFRTQFVNRYADMINTVYQPANYKGNAQTMDNVIKNEIVLHQKKYGNKVERDKRVAVVYKFIDDRPNNVRNHIASVFGTSKNTITLSLEPANAGKIKISTIVPPTYPWNGVYFNGIPVEVVALPNDGYEFESWTLNSSTVLTNPKETLTLSGTTSTLKLKLKVKSTFPILKITEISYNEIMSNLQIGEWIELHNAGTETLNLGSWVFKDGFPANKFVFPASTSLAPGGYLVVAKSVVAFKAKYPSVTNVVGGFNFSLSNGGDYIRLYDAFGQLKINLRYTDSLALADGNGATLELMKSHLDFMDMKNWQAKCVGGSPGKETQPCTCSLSLDLGEDVMSCDPVSVSLQTNLDPANKLFYWYRDGDLISIQPSYAAHEANKYTVVVHAGTCLLQDQKTIRNLSVDLGPDFSLCDYGSKTLVSPMVSNGLSYLWKKNGEQFANTPQVRINQPGEYSLSLSNASCAAVTDVVKVSSGGPIPNNLVYCKEDLPVVVSVQGTGTYTWYNTAQNGTVLGKGNTLLLNQLTSDTTVYVQEDAAQKFTLGISNSTPNFGVKDIGSSGHSFTVFNELSLDAVSVRRSTAQATMNLMVRILNAQDAVIFEKAMVLSATTELVRVPLGVKLAAGNYKIDAFGSSSGTDAQLRFESTNLAYPYTIPDLISITGSTSGATDRYNFFYNWEISKGKAPCARVPLFLTRKDCFTTGVTSKLSENELYAYPNPVNGVLYFSKKVNSANIFNLSGTLQLAIPQTHEYIDLGALESGLYLLELFDDQGVKQVFKVELMR